MIRVRMIRTGQDRKYMIPLFSQLNCGILLESDFPIGLSDKQGGNKKGLKAYDQTNSQ